MSNVVQKSRWMISVAVPLSTDIVIEVHLVTKCAQSLNALVLCGFSTFHLAPLKQKQS